MLVYGMNLKNMERYFVTHEMMGPTPEERIRDFLQQRAFFNRDDESYK